MKKLVSKIKALVEFWKASRLGRALARYGAAKGELLIGGIAYSGLFSVFAGMAIGISVMMAVIGGNTELREAVIEATNNALPGIIKDSSGKGMLSIDDLVVDSALNLGSIIGTAVLLFSALKVMDAMKKSLRAIFGIAETTENFIFSKLRDLGGFVLLMVSVLATAAAGMVAAYLGRYAADAIGMSKGASTGIWVLTLLGSFIVDTAVMYLMISLAGIKPPRRDLLIGSAIGAVGFGLLRALGTSIVSSAADDPLLASFAALVTILVWLQLAAQVLLYVSAWIANPPTPMPVPGPELLRVKQRPNHITMSVPETLEWPHNELTGVMMPDLSLLEDEVKTTTG
ncbi:MAG: hypothetical protein CSA83_01685 [Actinomycetales bacterium]|nr:MAG: hypothetical protein CSA83_01685 [Actinomycetales bacterium]